MRPARSRAAVSLISRPESQGIAQRASAAALLTAAAAAATSTAISPPKQVVRDALREDAGDIGDLTTLSTCVPARAAWPRS